VPSCEDLGNPENGNVATSHEYLLGSTATYSCDTNYMITGATTRTCDTVDGNGLPQWAPEAPTCEG